MDENPRRHEQVLHDTTFSSLNQILAPKKMSTQEGMIRANLMSRALAALLST